MVRRRKKEKDFAFLTMADRCYGMKKYRHYISIASMKSWIKRGRWIMRNVIFVLLVSGVLAGSLCGGLCAEWQIQAKTVEYGAQGTTMKGFLAYDQNVKGRRPAVLVVPEWWGLNDYARKRARMLAELGYAALAVDMYGEGKVATTPEDAKRLSGEAMKNFDLSRDRFLAAMKFLKQQPMVDPDRLAAIGYCFGGGIVLNMARQGTDLKGVASFHGDLTAVRNSRPGGIKAQILVLAGSEDSFVPLDKITGFANEMNGVGALFTIVLYSGAMHSFTNPEATVVGKKFNMPVAYNARADRESWAELERFLKELFR